MASTSKLERKAIPDLLGYNFYIPDYQRGYRWEEQQVFQLLNDLWKYFFEEKRGGFYCLQPVVVKECPAPVLSDGSSVETPFEGPWYEVIDGQQRLTTIRLLIAINNSLYENAKQKTFRIHYQTREHLGGIFDLIEVKQNGESYQFSIKEPKPEENVDVVYIENCISSFIRWSGRKGLNPTKVVSFFSQLFEDASSKKSVQVLWYEANGDKTDARLLFERLNDLSIPLSCSELIRAIFLSSSSEYRYDGELQLDEDDPDSEVPRLFKAFKEQNKKTKQDHINSRWDEIEHALKDDNFWSFITNKPTNSFRNRIELIFDLMSKKNTPEDPADDLHKGDPLYTYLFFDRLVKQGKDLWDIWDDVEACFARLRYWYSDRDYYHRIGFLSYIKGDVVLTELIDKAGKLFRNDFDKLVTQKIKDSLPAKDRIEALSYDNKSDYSNLLNLLILHNIETSRLMDSQNYFPFRQFKKKGESSWTLEHIHAQSSECIDQSDKRQWVLWAHENRKALENFEGSEGDGKESLMDKLGALTDESKEKYDYQDIQTLFNEVFSYYDKKKKDEGLAVSKHEISNLALLSGDVNSGISNSVFEVKRQEIVKRMAEDEYIPICTIKVFNKLYYDKAKGEKPSKQLFYWSNGDRDNYLSDIYEKLSDYLR